MMHKVGDCVSIYSPEHGRHYLGIVTKIYKRRHRMKTFTETVIDVEWLENSPVYCRSIPLRQRNVTNLGAAA
jgi:predicted Mrr-cat superfamily restriction endonuclease